MTPGRRVVLFVALGLAGGRPLAAGETGAAPPGRGLVAIWSGCYDLFDQGRIAEAGVQWRAPRRLWVLRPFAGGMVNFEGSYNLHAGIAYDWRRGPWTIRPSFAPGYYDPGGGKDLGHALEFRSGLELSRRLGPRVRVGLELYHLSNAGLADHNPGETSLVLTVGLPVPGRR